MKILLLTNYYPPEIGGASHLYSELARTLLARGHIVTVVTGVPRYNIAHAGRQRLRLITRETVDGVRVIRVFIPNIPRKLVFLRGLEHFVIALALFFGCLAADRHDVSIVYSPPLPLGLTALAIRTLMGTKVIVNIQDLFPQEVIDLGLLKNPFVISFLRGVESFIYRRADRLTTHSLGNKAYVVSRGAAQETVSVVPNWVDTDFVKPLPRLNEFRSSIGASPKEFVVTFAGTLGFCQDLDVIVKAAQMLREYTSIRFIIVGEGPSKQSAIDASNRMGLTNIEFLPVQPREVYPQVLAASDLCLVTLNKDLRTPVVPSRLLTIMAAGRPAVAAVNPGNDAWQIVQNSGCGICARAGNPQALAEAILSLYDDPTRVDAMGQAGRECASKQFSRHSCIAMYEELVASIMP